MPKCMMQHAGAFQEEKKLQENSKKEEILGCLETLHWHKSGTILVACCALDLESAGESGVIFPLKPRMELKNSTTMYAMVSHSRGQPR